MKKLMFTTAAMLGASALFATEYSCQTFESLSTGSLAGNASGGYFLFTDKDGVMVASDGETKVEAYGAAPVWPGKYPLQETGAGVNFLHFSTGTGLLWTSINGLRNKENSDTELTFDPQQIDSSKGLFIDTMVQFTATEADSIDGDPDGFKPLTDKIAIWLEKETADDSTSYKLCVRAGKLSSQDNGNGTLKLVNTPTTYTISTSIDDTAWVRLTIESINGYLKTPSMGNTSNSDLVGFKIYLNGELLSADVSSVDDSVCDYAKFMKDTFGTDWDPDAMISEVGVFLETCELNKDPRTLSAVGFKGTGKLDNLVFTDDDPFEGDDVTGADFTLTVALGEGVSAVSYTIGGGETKSYVDGVTGLKTGDKVEFVPTYAPWYGNAVLTEKDDDGSATATINGLTVTVGTTSDSVSIAAARVDTTVTDATKLEDIGITGGAAAALDPANSTDKAVLTSVIDWAAAGDVSPETVSSELLFETGTATNETEMAYLLNTTVAGLDAAKTAFETKFKITSITQDASNNWVLKYTEVNGGSSVEKELPSEQTKETFGYNGVVKKVSSTSVDGTYDTTSKETGANLLFYKFRLDPPAALLPAATPAE